jgi:hypothetical protein
LVTVRVAAIVIGIASSVAVVKTSAVRPCVTRARQQNQATHKHELKQDSPCFHGDHSPLPAFCFLLSVNG